MMIGLVKIFTNRRKGDRKGAIMANVALQHIKIVS